LSFNGILSISLWGKKSSTFGVLLHQRMAFTWLFNHGQVDDVWLTTLGTMGLIREIEFAALQLWLHYLF